MISVLIADDHPVVREGLRLILSQAPDISVRCVSHKSLGLSDNGLIGLCDVLLLDVTLIRNGEDLEVLRRIREIYCKLPVLVISIHSERECGLPALKAGASGYITTTSSPAELMLAVRKVASRGRYISPGMAEMLAQALDQADEQSPKDILSTREFQVFLRLVAGERPTLIARSLGLSIKTISTYRARILDKLNLKTNCHLVHYAIQRDLASSLDEYRATKEGAFFRNSA